MSVNSSLSKLTTLYKNGIILYPRTDNNLMPKDESCHFYPHPKLMIVGMDISVKKGDKILLDSYSLPLFLTQKGVATPSTIQPISEYIKKFTEHDMLISLDKKKEVDKRMNLFDSFLGLNSIKPENIVKKLNNKIQKESVVLDFHSAPPAKKSRSSIFQNEIYLKLKLKEFLLRVKKYKEISFKEIINKMKEDFMRKESIKMVLKP